MTNRESLHKLIDALPEAALESTERILQNYEAWMRPPEPPADVTRMRREVEERFRRSAAEHAARTGKGIMTGATFGSSRFGAEGDGQSSMMGWEGESLVKVELHVFRGHRLDIEERLRISEDKKSLIYAQQIKGPAGKEGRYEIEFDIAPEGTR